MSDGGIQTEVPANPEIPDDFNKELKIKAGQFLLEEFKKKGGDLLGDNSFSALPIYLKGSVCEMTASKLTSINSSDEYSGTVSEGQGPQVQLVEINLPLNEQELARVVARKKEIPLDQKEMRGKNLPLFYSPNGNLGFLFGVNGTGSEIMINKIPISKGSLKVPILMTSDDFIELAESIGFKK